MRIILLNLVFVCGFENANCQDSIIGCYSSNFAIIGWFGLHLKLNSDSTFDYLFAGDLFYDKISGNYTIQGKYIELNFPLNTDSLTLNWEDSLCNLHSFKFPVPENISANNRPSKLKYVNDKLIIYNRFGKIIRKERNKNMRKRKYYLMKHLDHENIN